MTIDQFELRALGYTGGLDQDGYVEHDQVKIPLDQKAAVTRAMVGLLTDVKLGSGRAPKFYVATFEGSRIGQVKYRETKSALDQTLLMDGIVEGGQPVPIRGAEARMWSKRRHEWAPVPPADVLTKLPTVDVVREWPDFYIAGPGQALASAMPCPHAYHLTDSCPNCDAEQATPEQRQALLEVVLGPTPTERRRETLKAALGTAYETAQQEQADVRYAFMRDIQGLGPVRATSLWARKAMAWETRVSVWGHGVDLGNAGGDWSAAVDASELMAVRLLKESVTPTRNAVDRALSEVQGRTAAELLDTIESFRKAVDR